MVRLGSREASQSHRALGFMAPGTITHDFMGAQSKIQSHMRPVSR